MSRSTSVEASTPTTTSVGFAASAASVRSGYFRGALGSSDARIAPSFGGTRTSGASPVSSAPFDGIARAYVHEAPHELGVSLFSAAGPFFFLRAGRPLKNIKTQRVDAEHTDDTPAAVNQFASRSNDVHSRDPFVLSQKKDKDMTVVIYKQLRKNERTVIELLYHCVLVERPDGEVVINFEPLSEEVLKDTDRAAFDDLHERRKGVMRNNFSIVSGKETGCLVLTPDAIGCSRVLMAIRVEYDVEIDDERRMYFLRQAFAPLQTALEACKRCDWVDNLERERFITIAIPQAPEATSEELAMIDNALKYNVDDSQLQRVRGSLKKYPSISMFVGAGSSDKVVWGKGYGDVDVALEEVFAFVWKSCSYERMAAHRRKHGDLLRTTDAEDGRRTQIMSSEQKTAPTLANRWYRTKFTWLKLDSGDIAVAFEPTTAEGREVRFTPEAVEGKISGLYLFKEVAPRITTFTIVQSGDLGRAVPKWFAEALVPTTMSLILRAQEKFRRPDRVVDKEMREMIASRIRSSKVELEQDSETSLHYCSTLRDEFEDVGARHLIKPLLPTSPFVRCSMRPATKSEDARLGSRPIATGKAAADIDSSVEEAAAWLFDGCSRDRMRINKEDNKGLPRVIVSLIGGNILVSGTLKLLPFPLYSREYVVCMTWQKVDSDRVVIAVCSVDKVVDYGLSTSRVVRGATTAFYLLERTGLNSCSIVLYQKIDVGGSVPVAIVNSHIAVPLSVVDELRTVFQRDEEVDCENRRAAIAEMNNWKLDDEEQALFASVAELLARGATVVKTSVEGSIDHFVKVFCLSRPSSTRLSLVTSTRRSLAVTSVASRSQHEDACFEAAVVVDASVKECVAWSLLLCSRQRTQSLFDNYGVASRSETTPSSSRRLTTDVYLNKHKIGGLTERREVIESVWSSTDDGSKYVVVEQHQALELNDNKLKSCNVSEITFSVAEELSGSIPQTAITMKLTFEKGLSSSQEDQALIARTRPLSELRKTFDKSVEIDRRRREVFCQIVNANKEVYVDRELDILNEGIKMFSHFEGQGAKMISMASPSTFAKVAYLSGDSRAWGWASGLVRTEAVDVLAYLQDFMRRAGMRRDDVEKMIIETANNHNVLVYNWKKAPKIISDRDFLGRALWRSMGDKGFELITTPEECAERPRRRGVVRAKYPSVWRIVGVAGKEFAKVEYVIHPDFGGSVPTALFNFYAKYSLERVTEVQDYFQRLRPFATYDEKDGVAIGETFMIKTKEEKQTKKRGGTKYQIRVSNIVKGHFAIKDFSTLHPWFPSLVEGMLSGRLRGMKNIRSKLENLSNKEALTIGHSFSGTLRARKSAQAGCDVWINEYPALVLLAKRERFFVPMAHTIGQRKIETAPWGLRWKVGLGAVLGVLDIATDAYAIANFTLQGKHGYARAVIASVSVSMAIQLLMIYANGRKRGKRHVVKEALIVLSGLKPAVDAFRVIGGAKAHEDEAFDPMFELISAKVVEIVAESIPSSLVQIYALLTYPLDAVSTASIASIIVSIATISLGGATICFDFDLDPERRIHSPYFYGYVPNSSGKRTIVFYSIFCFTACHVALRMIGIALLVAVSAPITAAVLGGDLVFFMLFKLARDDLRYWLKLPGALSWALSIFIRLFTKLMVDFTVMVQLRHPNETGGLYWCVCLLLGQATSFVAVHLYYSENVGALEVGTTSTKYLWGLIGGLEAAFVVFFATFVVTINKKYVSTFFSTMTAKDFNQKNFRGASTDLTKFAIFTVHPSYFESIRGEVTEWVRENWDIWNEEKREWFTERAKASVPKDMIRMR